MAYQIYLGGELMPITPEKIKTKYKGQNKEINLLNDKNINFIKAFKLPTWEMELLIPAYDYPFRNKTGVTRSRDYYLTHFNNLAAKKQAFNMLIVRTLPNGRFDYGENKDTFISNNNGIIINTAVSLEEYSVTDDAGEGFDIKINVSLKKYVGFGTQKISLNSMGQATAQSASPRVDIKPQPKSYTVKKGDTLYNICRAQLGSGEKYKEIAKLNNIANANLIYPGKVIKLE